MNTPDNDNDLDSTVAPRLTDDQLREHLPPLRTFRVLRYRAIHATGDPTEELTLFAHAIQYSETGVLFFVWYDIANGAVAPHFSRILKDYIEVEEIRSTPIPPAGLKLMLN